MAPMRTAEVARSTSLARLEREVETLAMDLAVLEELQQRVCPQLDWEDLDSDVGDETRVDRGTLCAE